MFSQNPYLRSGIYFALILSLAGYLFHLATETHSCGAEALARMERDYPILAGTSMNEGMVSLDEYDWESAQVHHLSYRATNIPNTAPAGLTSVLSKRPEVELPTWPGCTDDDYQARLECTVEQLVGFIRENLQPMEGHRGRVIVLYDVTLAGTVVNSELYEGSDPALTAETMRLVGIMQGKDMRFIPGKVNGEQRVLKLGLGIAFGGGCQGCEAAQIEVFQVE